MRISLLILFHISFLTAQGVWTLQDKFSPTNVYNSKYGYGYTNLYGYSGYDYVIGGYRMFVPLNGDKELRSFNKDRTLSTGTNLNVNRSRSSSRSS